MKYGLTLIVWTFCTLWAGITSAQIEIAFAASQPTCNGYTNGTITALPTGGAGPYGYYWNNGQGGQTNLGCNAGNYVVTVTDQLGITATASYVLSQPAPVVAIITPTDFACLGMSGTLVLSASGAPTPLSYAWEGGATTASITATQSGNYFATVTDANGCSDAADFFLPPGGSPNVTVFPAYLRISPLCNGGNNGSITVTNVWGSNPPFTYQWQNGTANQALTSITAGEYKITFTDAQGCTMSDKVVLLDNPAQIVEIAKIDINCSKYPGTGQVNALAAGGVNPFTYLWNDGNTSSFRQNVNAGIYTCTVTDANGCTKSATAEVLQAPEIHVDVTAYSPSCGGNSGSATVQASGGFPPYKYLWSNGQMGATATNLAPGTYYICTLDAVNCSKDTSIIIGETPGIAVNLLVTKAECPGVNNGIVTAIVDPPTGTYTYQWNLLPGLSVAQLNDVPANTTVFVTVTDIYTGCQGIASIFVGTHGLINVDVTTVDIPCGTAAGTATAVASGGTEPYTYTWFVPPAIVIGNQATITGLAAGAYAVSVVDSRGCITLGVADIQSQGGGPSPDFNMNVMDCLATGVSIQLTDLSTDTTGTIAAWSWVITTPAGTQTFNQQNPPPITMLPGQTGSVTLTVTSANGCVSVLTEAINAPALPQVNLNVGASVFDCENDPINLVVTGTAGNTYTWSPMTDLTFNPDAQNVTADPAQTTSYTVTATNGGCVATKVVEVKVVTPINLEFDNSLLQTCDSTATLTATTNAANVVWLVNGSPVGSGNPFVVPVSGTVTFEAVATSADNCTDKDSLTVEGNTVDINVAAIGGVTACTNQPATIAVTNLDPTDVLTYTWSSSNPNVTITIQGNPSVSVSSAQAGSYTVTVKVRNQHNCERILTIPFTVDPGNDITALFDANICTGLAVAFTNTSGVSGTWHFGDTFTSTDPNPTHTYSNAGPYTVSFVPSSTSTCVQPVSLPINVSATILNAVATASTASCVEQAVIQFNGMANSQNIESWNWVFTPTGTSNVQNPVMTYTLAASGTATLTVTDTSGCTATSTIPVQIDIVNEAIAATSNLCPGQTVELNPTFNGNYTYQWTAVPADPNLDVNNPNPTVSPAVPTVYTATVINGACSAVFAQSVNLLVAATVELPVDQVVCIPSAVTLAILNGTGTSYDWSTQPNFTDIFANGNTVSVDPQPNGMIYVRANNTENCPGIDSMRLNLASVEAAPESPNLKVCAGTEVQLDINNLDPNDDLTFVWSPALDNVNNPVIGSAIDATYTVIVTNQHNCKDTLSVAVDATQLLVTASIPGPDTVCIGVNTTLLANATGDGSTFNYTWTPDESLLNANTNSPTAQPIEQTTYVVNATDEFGCIDTAQVTVFFISNECVEPYIFIPRAFTPNNDSNNDLFIIRGINITELYFVVWDRWGEKVYETEDPKATGWDGNFKGKELTPDSYAWYVRVKCGNGGTYTKKGDVTLLK